MVTYLKEHDSYKSFLMGGYSAHRNDNREAGSKTDHAPDGVDDDNSSSMSGYLSASISDTVQILIDCVWDRKAEIVTRKPGLAAPVDEVNG